MDAPVREWKDGIEARVRALAAVPYLVELPAQDIQALAREARLLRAGKGKILFGRPVSGGIEFVLAETNQEIAAQIGTVRELVSRTLGVLRREGLIRTSGRRILIPDLERLRARADVL